ncbi:uncharacterized protein Dvar_04090 [Desulfosarcina variabilis str. Montpellier]
MHLFHEQTAGGGGDQRTGGPPRHGAGAAETDGDDFFRPYFLFPLPEPPAVNAGPKIVDLLQSIGVEPDLVEQKEKQHHRDDARRPGEHVPFGDQPDGQQIKQRSDQFDPAHGIAGKSNSDRVGVHKGAQNFHQGQVSHQSPSAPAGFSPPGCRIIRKRESPAVSDRQ